MFLALRIICSVLETIRRSNKNELEKEKIFHARILAWKIEDYLIVI